MWAINPKRQLVHGRRLRQLGNFSMDQEPFDVGGAGRSIASSMPCFSNGFVNIFRQHAWSWQCNTGSEAWTGAFCVSSALSQCTGLSGRQESKQASEEFTLQREDPQLALVADDRDDAALLDREVGHIRKRLAIRIDDAARFVRSSSFVALGISPSRGRNGGC